MGGLRGGAQRAESCSAVHRIASDLMAFGGGGSGRRGPHPGRPAAHPTRIRQRGRRRPRATAAAFPCGRRGGSAARGPARAVPPPAPAGGPAFGVITDPTGSRGGAGRTLRTGAEAARPCGSMLAAGRGPLVGVLSHADEPRPAWCCMKSVWLRRIPRMMNSVMVQGWPSVRAQSRGWPPASSSGPC